MEEGRGSEIISAAIRNEQESTDGSSGGITVRNMQNSERR